MASIRPFAAYRYDLKRVRADDVVTQPYDKITPEMQRTYLARSPYNLVRIILGEKHSSDSNGNNVYTRAADHLNRWIQERVLVGDAQAGVYPYTQTFQPPGSSEKFTRRGFIALGRIEDYTNKVVFRHEQTLSGPKQDRLSLLRATHTHFGQIFMLYSDPAQQTESELLERARQPVLEAADEYGTVHRLFRETDAAVIGRLQQGMADHKLIIADGHHRYETALAWRDEQRNGTRPHGSGNHAFDWVMMTFVNLDAPGLVVLPTHRLVHSLAGFDSKQVRDRLNQWFDVQPLAIPPAEWAARWDEINSALARASATTITLAAALGGTDNILLLHLKASLDLGRELPAYLPEQRKLDVVALHELVLARALGITPEAVREERNLHYFRDARAALNAVRSGGGQAAFFLRPLPPQQVRDVALAGGVMPQKSTDFYPKLLSGLTMYRVENRA